MKCNKCNEEIEYVKVHRFTYDGADLYTHEPILGGKDNTCNYIDIDTQATMFEFDDDYEEFTNQIYCPKCDKYPFKGSVSIFERAHVVFGISDKEDFDE